MSIKTKEILRLECPWPLDNPIGNIICKDIPCVNVSVVDKGQLINSHILMHLTAAWLQHYSRFYNWDLQVKLWEQVALIRLVFQNACRLLWGELTIMVTHRVAKVSQINSKTLHKCLFKPYCQWWLFKRLSNSILLFLHHGAIFFHQIFPFMYLFSFKNISIDCAYCNTLWSTSTTFSDHL